MIISRPEQGGFIVQKIDDFVFGGAKELFGVRNKIGLLSSFKKHFDFFICVIVNNRSLCRSPLLSLVDFPQDPKLKITKTTKIMEPVGGTLRQFLLDNLERNKT